MTPDFEETSPEDPIDPGTYSISRTVRLTSNHRRNWYHKRGIIFAPIIEKQAHYEYVLHLHNQGCEWFVNLHEEQTNDFKVFSTGDAFSTISPTIILEKAYVTIHVGMKHKIYSPLVMLHEALQLCRTASEHGAKEITIALPEQYYFMFNPCDFNVLLADFFKASGADILYFYNDAYQGTFSENAKIITCSKKSMVHFLQGNERSSLDEKIMHNLRKKAFNHYVVSCEVNQTSITELFNQDLSFEYIQIPDIKSPPHILLCCSANQPFALEVAARLTARGESVQTYCIEGQGAHSTIPSNLKISGATVTIIQATRPNPDNLELAHDYQINGAAVYFFEAMMIARQAHFRGAAQINFVNPYQFNARSDKAEDNSNGKTGAYVQHNGLLVRTAGVNYVITAECHDPHTLSGTYTGKKIKGSAVQALTIMATQIAEQWFDSSPEGQLRLVTPDAGAATRTKKLTQILQAIMGKKLCESRVVGGKERNSHHDNSAFISTMDLGTIGINAIDKYLITDDEAATCSTICQAIQNLKKHNAQDISVAIVHNNMSLDWLLRQLCLARILILGVNDIHFSDTQEMGSLAKSYDHLIQTYAKMTALSINDIETLVCEWFKQNIAEVHVSYDSFKQVFSELSSRVFVHHLADAFVYKIISHGMPEVDRFKAQKQDNVFILNTFFSGRHHVTQSAPTPDVPESTCNNTSHKQSINSMN